jgi:hypothetical protein
MVQGLFWELNNQDRICGLGGSGGKIYGACISNSRLSYDNFLFFFSRIIATTN